jgi:6-pyruvoyltetrahydropterin/6-carboxytetrahydropterin synthase
VTFRVAVRKKFIAQHYLIGGDWGPENELHSHPYMLEVELEGAELDKHGYLVDIVTIEAGMGEIVNYYSEKTLNDLAEFEDLNPSIEHFACILNEMLRPLLSDANLIALTVNLWEHDEAWASYLHEF